MCGRKRWLLLPPWHTHLLYDRTASRLAPHLEPWRLPGADVGQPGCDGAGARGGDWAEVFPGLAEARRHAFELVQVAGAGGGLFQ